MNRKENFTAGFIRENPVFGLYLGCCSTLAITTSLNNAIGMGVSVIIVLILSNVIISMMRKIIPDEIRIPVYIVVIAALVKSIELLIKAYASSIDAALGLFLPLIVVNCIILGRAEAYASKNKVLPSALDGVCMGLGFGFALVLMGFFRELLGAGTVLSGLSTLLPFLSFIPAEGFAIPGLSANPAVMMILPAGGFLMMGFIFAVIQKIMAGKEDK